MAGHPPLTDDEKGQIIRRVRAGEPVRAIARSINRERKNIYKFLKLAGVSVPRPEGRWNIYDDGDLERLIVMDFPNPAIAKAMQRTVPSIYHRRRLLGFLRDPRKRKWTKAVRLSVRPSTWKSAKEAGDALGMAPHEMMRVVLRAAARQDLWERLCWPVPDLMMPGDKD